ncbi:chitinase 2-like [Vicia villosa]|uniref:chitinase 2-like n=1 Tax=Vicia villosa TaxID=3911 RepID=UPI00273C4A5E|nr:chitinase 2-like [Vicia villosa]
MSKLIFREYIGVKPSLLTDFPIEIINTKSFEFHYILGFASEGYDKNGKGDGIFKETWNVNFFGPEKVNNLKKRYPNVKVVISIGGRDAETPFDPVDETVWIKEAVKSLKVLIGKYNSESGNTIDGIDINYETIKTSPDRYDDLFVKCIGKVITELKNDRDLKITVVSIATSEINDSHYRNLYYAYKGIINWVDYQFYNQKNTISTVEEFVVIYDNLIKDYPPQKVLPGFSTDPNDTKNNKISREIFIAGCVQLKKHSKFQGVFLWNANDSATLSQGEREPYIVEHILQDVLTKSDDELLAIRSQ